MNKKLILFIYLLPAISLLIFGSVELTGSLTKEEILKNLPDWEEEAASYFPNQEIIQSLKSVSFEVKIEVFIGTWCPDCKRNVSAYFKILEIVDNPLIQTTYIGVPKKKEARKPFIKGKNIKRIPTFIITVNSKEKGRIIENPTKSVEEDILDIINR